MTVDIRDRWAFNTAIAAVIELVNELYRYPEADPAARRFATATAASLMFLFAPHLGAEVYERLTGERVWEQPWPAADPAMLVADTFELVCQVNGKVRDRVTAPTGASREELERLALDVRGRQGAPERSPGRQGDRRAGQAGQRRRPLSGWPMAAAGATSRTSP